MSIRSPAEIDPQRRYTFAEACAYFPGRKGKRIHLATLHRWFQDGLFSGFRVGHFWYVTGAEILKLLRADTNPLECVTSPAQRKRRYEAVRRRLREQGVKLKD